MQLSVGYFALYREATGTDSEVVQSDAETPAQLFAECARRHPALERFDASLVAVNDEMVTWDSALASGDKVLFFPPVAGG